MDGVVDGLGLALGVARADHEEVGVAGDPAQVDHGDVDGLAVGGDGGDPVGQRLAVLLRCLVGGHGMLAGSSRAHAGGVEPALGHQVGHGVGHQVAHRPALAPRARAPASTRCRSAASRRSRSCRCRPGRAGAAARPRAPSPSRAATATRASSSTRSGSCHEARWAAWSAPRISVSSSSGRLVAQSAAGCRRCTTGPPRSHLELGHLEPVGRRRRRAGTAPAARRRRARARSRGGAPGPSASSSRDPGPAARAPPARRPDDPGGAG